MLLRGTLVHSNPVLPMYGAGPYLTRDNGGGIIKAEGVLVHDT